MLVGTPVDDREIIRQTIQQIRELFKEIVALRNEDRSKYKEMCNRLDVLERDRSHRTKKNRQRMKKAKKASAQSKNTSSTNPSAAGVPKKTASKNSKLDSPSFDGTQKTDEKAPDKAE